MRVYKEGEKSDLHKALLDPSRFDYDPDFARAGSLQFMHPLQCSKVLGRPYPEDLASKGQVAFDEDIVAYRAPKPIQGKKISKNLLLMNFVKIRLNSDPNHHRMELFSGVSLKRLRLLRVWLFSKLVCLKTAPVLNLVVGLTV